MSLLWKSVSHMRCAPEPATRWPSNPAEPYPSVMVDLATEVYQQLYLLADTLSGPCYLGHTNTSVPPIDWPFLTVTVKEHPHTNTPAENCVAFRSFGVLVREWWGGLRVWLFLAYVPAKIGPQWDSENWARRTQKHCWRGIQRLQKNKIPPESLDRTS